MTEAAPQGTETTHVAKERMYTLKDIIELTGHANTRSAYSALRRKGYKTEDYQTSKGAPVALYTESVVREAFHKQLLRASIIRKVSIDALFEDTGE